MTVVHNGVSPADSTDALVVAGGAEDALGRP
jgi:hypothetical protein